MAKDNLFALDLDATLCVLAEANLDLAHQFGRLRDQGARLPPALATDDEVGRAREVTRAAASFHARCRAARLEDTRPLRTFAAKVDEFFKDMETEAARARDHALALLTEAGRQGHRAAMSSLQTAATAPDAAAVGPTRAGAAATACVLSAVAAPSPSAAASIPMAWEVGAVDRARIDLEALRPFLTDAALLAAARAHLKAHGPHALPGAAYADRAQLH